MIRSVTQRISKLERRAAGAEADPLLVLVRSYRVVDNPAVDADLDALKAGGFLRGNVVRTFRILDSGDIEGLTDRERQFLDERRRSS